MQMQPDASRTHFFPGLELILRLPSTPSIAAMSHGLAESAPPTICISHASKRTATTSSGAARGGPPQSQSATTKIARVTQRGLFRLVSAYTNAHAPSGVSQKQSPSQEIQKAECAQSPSRSFVALHRIFVRQSGGAIGGVVRDRIRRRMSRRSPSTQAKHDREAGGVRTGAL
ncbi:hypothetical protein BD310DRAFT_140924 [Dichomitus squalens]|uniref:Uncharacterized protein n=1 Tax=Dichomitus squalens TaxID=114155 RepID=A0A4Q9PI16_9APHY|nr:hypothetical protein BD310DRAFT_140924 [Dichomitus squalens]